jgi:CheY-like chemotaxis protein
MYVRLPADMPMTPPEFCGARTVMLVDGRPEARIVTSRILQHAGYTVVTAANVREAIAMLRRETALLMALDMILEGSSDGMDCYRGAIAIFEWLSRVMATGSSVHLEAWRQH